MKSSLFPDRKFKLIASNRRARHDYEIVSTFEAGIILQGTEVKSLRNGRCSLQEAYAGFKSQSDDGLFIFNMNISHYEHGNRQNHEPNRARKLLIHKREVFKIKTAVNEKGMTIVPLKIYFSGHLVKLELALVRAKRKYDKREALKKRDADREIRKKFRY